MKELLRRNPALIKQHCGGVLSCEPLLAAQLAANTLDHARPDSRLRSTVDRQETGFPLPWIHPQRAVLPVFFVALP